MNTPSTSSAEFFEAKYKQQSDPWDFATSAYERSRYNAILAALNHRHYCSAFEPGCSIGVLTEQLASLADTVLALEFSAAALTQARTRCAHLPGVQFECASLADRTNLTGFDLVVLSEIGYYFASAPWTALSARLIQAMDKDATLLASHWLGHSPDHCISGDQVHTILNANTQLALEHSERHEHFRLDRWRRV